MSTFANGSIAIAICDRCRRKVPYLELRPDGNVPGLRVCKDPGCWDMKDPWRLPPIQPDSFILRFPRPDTSIAPDSVAPTAFPFGDEAETPAPILQLEEGGDLQLEQGGNLELES